MGRNAGQTILTVVGTAVGSYFGQPQLGFMLGSLAGQAIFPTQLPGVEGPRLNDLQVQSSAIGAPIPLVYGTYTVAGNVIWSSGLVETVTTEELGGKGGPTQSQTTYTYRASLAIGLAEGEIAGIVRIWADAKVIYDRRIQQPGESDADFSARLVASDATEAQLVFYPGDESQLADPTIEALEGAGNVPGYRGLCYVVFTDFQLADYGNRIPNFRFELYTDGTAAGSTVTNYAGDVVYPWLTGNDPQNPLNDHIYGSWSAGTGYNSITPAGDGPNSATEFTSLAGALDYANAFRITQADAEAATNYVSCACQVYWLLGTRYGNLVAHSSNRQAEMYPHPADAERDRVRCYLHFTAYPPGEYVQADEDLITGPTGKFVSIDYVLFDYNDSAAGSGVAYVADPYDAMGADLTPPWPNQNGTWGSPGSWTTYGPRSSFGGVDPYYWYGITNVNIWCQRVPRAPRQPSADPTYTQYPGLPDWYISPTGELVPDEAWTKVTATHKVLQKYATQTDPGTAGGAFAQIKTYPLDPALPTTDPDYSSQAYWEAAYNAAVAAGEPIEAGLTYGVDYPVTVTYAYKQTYTQNFVTTNPITLASIVADLCARCGLEAGDINTAALTKTVLGYAVTRVMNGRAAIDPLRSYGFFDAAESQAVLNFVVRGGASVATILDDDLGAAVGDAQVTRIEVDRLQEVELPRRLRVHYIAPTREYEPAEQASSRLTTSAVNLADLELPLAMTDDAAAQVGEVLLFEAWIARNTYRFTVDHTYLELDPADPITVELDGSYQRMRVLGIEYALPNLLTLDAVRDDLDIYTSTATGQGGTTAPPSLALTSPTAVYLLDLPALRDADDEAGYYAALRPTLSGANSWGGGVVYRSADGGASYTNIGGASSSVAAGTLVADVAVGPSTIWDNGNTVSVTLLNGTLESRDADSVIAGANAAAIGAHGRWEIIQFTTVTMVGSTAILSGLLRGRRGTEHNIGLTVAGDAFVLLSAGAVVRLPLDLAKVGYSQPHKAVTFGLTIDGATATSFAGAGEALKPFSPVNIQGARDGSGNLTITWVRRGRLGQELPDGTDIPISEENEDYEVVIYKTGSPIRTISSSVETVTYTVAQQVTDFGSSQSSIDVKIYQRSASVGRGQPGEETL
jgi:hypothetical protein